MLCGDSRLCRDYIVIHYPEGLHCLHSLNGSRPTFSRAQRPRSQSSRPGSFPTSGYPRGAAMKTARVPMVWQSLCRTTAAPDAALSLKCFCDVAGGSPAPNPLTHRPDTTLPGAVSYLPFQNVTSGHAPTWHPIPSAFVYDHAASPFGSGISRSLYLPAVLWLYPTYSGNFV